MHGQCLKKMEDGRFTLGDHEFHCGDPIDVYVRVRLVNGKTEEDCWIEGRVEHNAQGYYFCNKYGPSFPLYAGIIARIPGITPDPDGAEGTAGYVGPIGVPGAIGHLDPAGVSGPDGEDLPA